MDYIDIARRQFLKSCLKTGGTIGLALVAGPIFGNSILPSQNTTITFRGANYELGHRILNPKFPAASQTIETDVIIIGSGIAGLAAARHLTQHNFNNFIMVELEKTIGGNSSWSKNNLSKFPWGGHYLPIPNLDLNYIIDFLVECQVITGFNANNLPIYNEHYLCHDLKERLLINGRWQEGLIPAHGVPIKDKNEIERFLQLMNYYRHLKKNEKYAFNIPIDLSAKIEALLLLDKISMQQFLLKNNFGSEYLHWYVDYCCRDDYGVGIGSISAWAGIHYFASRRAKAANAESDAVLTWPEGNGFLVENLAKSFQKNIKTEWLAFEVKQTSPNSSEYNVNCFNAFNNETLSISAKCVILACPRFVASHLIRSLGKNEVHAPSVAPSLKEMSYSPWLVANISVKSVPGGRGADLAWDNVSYYSRSLGYIDAKHQNLQGGRGPTVLTYYLPLDNDEPEVSRKRALEANLNDWKNMIVQDLENMHPGISHEIEHIDLWIWGHGMIRPTKEFIWGKTRLALPRSDNGIFFAHSDMSGISIFEEAFWQGITTAKALIEYLKNSHTARI